MTTQGFVTAMFKELRLSEYVVEALILPDNDSDGTNVDITDDEDENEEDQYDLARELEKVAYKDGSKVMNLANIIADPESYGFFKSGQGEPVCKTASTALHDNFERVDNQN